MVAVAQLLRQFLPLLVFASAAAAGLTRTVGQSTSSEEQNSRKSSSSPGLLPPSTSSSTSSSVFVSVSSVPVPRPSGEWLLGRNETSFSLSQRIESTRQTESSMVTTQPSVINASNNEVALPKATGYGRGARDAANDPCDDFRIGNKHKREFYSPNWPNNYPNQTNCVKVLEADKGMVLTLGFRDRFDMEPSDKCAFDFIEVRDGQHGYANQLGIFCGKQYPPDLTSKTRFLWLRFRSDENIEYGGFKIVWDMIPRPEKNFAPEPESCVLNVTGKEIHLGSTNFTDRKALAERNNVPLDCMWVITVEPEWKIQLNFTDFKLQKPNECDANFVDVFDKSTDIPSRLKNFCGSIADPVSSNTNKVFIRFYVEPRAMNSSFNCIVTAYREKGGKPCREDEYDCEDARCIDESLKCNGQVNCRFRWDEDEATCPKTNGVGSMNKEHIIIILVVFSLIMFGMSFAFVFNCIRKLIRDHRIIQEHIRQSREDRLDEIGRKTTPCPSATRADSRETRGSSESPSVEVAPSKELLPPPPPSSCALMAHEYARELLAREAEYSANCEAMNDIHRSNNASNATQERLQESSEEPETRDNSCQTRESLFDGVPTPRRATPAPQSHCSACGCTSVSTCGRHSALIAAGIPPPPHGWSIHDPRYATSEPPDYTCSYQRFQSPKPTPPRDKYHSPAKYSRQSTFDSGTTTVGSSKHSSSTGPSAQGMQGMQGMLNSQGNDPRYRAEAVIELPEQERRPFSIESTKSAPDVIATH